MTVQQGLYLILKQASSQDPSCLKEAEKQLEKWEIEPGFYSELLGISANLDCEANARWLAMVYFKNGIDRYWRRNAPNGISEDEKSLIRPVLLSALNESEDIVATQLSVVLSKIARLDYPHDWPDLVHTLLNFSSQSSNFQFYQQLRSLQSLHQVIKSLVSKRLAGDRKLFQQLADNIFEFVLLQWKEYLIAFTRTNDEMCIKKGLICLKILRLLLSYGFPKPHESEKVMTFVSMVFERANLEAQIRREMAPGDLRNLLEKHLMNLTKMICDLLESFPFSFIPFLNPALEFAVSNILRPVREREAGGGGAGERFTVLCCNLLKSIVLCSEYRCGKGNKDVKDSSTSEANEIKQMFFTRFILDALTKQLVQNFFLLTEEDLQMWDSDPETFAMNGGEVWKYNLRPCSESLLLAICSEFNTTMVPILTSFLKELDVIVPPDNLQMIMRKDTIYNAIGIAAFHLYDEVDFDAWFTTTLQSEIQINSSYYRILKRRIAWYIGQWCGVKLSPALQPLLFQTLLSLLSPSDHDLIIRITAAISLKLAVDDFEFNVQEFMKFLPSAISLLCHLLKQVNECELKLQVLHVLAFIVERFGGAVRPFIQTLLDYLPQLWHATDKTCYNMLQSGVVCLLIEVVKAVGSQSCQLESFLLPVIMLSIDLHSDAHVYLLENGLELWLNLLNNSTHVGNSLLYLASHLPDIMQYSSEYLNLCIAIAQSYILLSQSDFLRMHGNRFAQTILTLSNELSSEGIEKLLKCVDTSIKLNEAISFVYFHPVISHVCWLLISNRKSWLTTEMLAEIVILSRVLLSSKQHFFEVMSDCSAKHGRDPNEVFSCILSIFMNQIENINPLERQKIVALALITLLNSTQSNEIRSAFHLIIKAVVESLNDIMQTDENGVEHDSLVISKDQLGLLTFNNSQKSDDSNVSELSLVPSFVNDDDFTAEAGDGDGDGCGEDGLRDCETRIEHLQRQLALSDPSHTLVLRDCLQQQIIDVKMQLGESKWNELMMTIDAETLEQLNDHSITL